MSARWALLEGPPEELVATDAARAWTRRDLLGAAQEAAELLRGARLAALWLPHRAEALAAIAGALQADAPYVPLDPRAPSALTQAILDDATPDRALWLADAPPPPPLTAQQQGRWFCSASLTKPPSSASPPPGVAYLLYTSGSVGQPRGVLQTRAGLEGHARRYVASLGLTARDRLLMVASVATDAAAMDLFGALAAGASLHLWDLRAAPLAGLAPWVAREGITVVHMTPTVFRAWAREAPSPRDLCAVRAVVLGGEAARPADLQLHRRLFSPQSALINGLGPTECTLALQRRFRADEPLPDAPLSVGWPLPGVEARLLDEADDGSGELGLRCDELALGYWGRPEETARAFLTLPDGGRLYRTGDRVRRGADGGWIYLGRLGRAHKIRGVQVDLDALEALLERAPGVARAALDLAPGAQGEVLTAWIALAPGQPPALAPLRAWLRARALPEQLPARWRLLGALPLTTSGKLDRAALRAQAPAAAGAPPGSEAARWLAARWAALLGAAELTEDSDFFAEGGDSLAALSLQDALRRERGVHLPLERLFDAPRLGDLAAWINTQAPAPQQETTGLTDTAMTPAELGIWLAQAAAPTSDAWSVPALQRLVGADQGALRRALEGVYADTPALRRRVERAPGRAPAWAPGAAPLAWEERQAASLGEGLAIAREVASAPFELERGPLLRACWIGLGAAEALLLVVGHHLIVDGEAIRGLMARWGARLRGAAPPGDAAQALAACDEAPAWWRERPREAQTLPAPLEGDPGVDPADRGRQWSLDAAATGRLRAWARARGATLGMAALTALAAALTRALGERLELGLVSAAPARAGWAQAALRTLPLRLEIDAEGTASALLGQARAQVLGALARAAAPQEALGPAPEVVFLMHGAPRPALAGHGEALALEPRDSPAPLLFSARDDGAALELGAAWRPQDIAPWAAERLVELWAAALERLSLDPDARLDALGALPDSQRAWLRRQQGARRPDMDLTSAIPALFAEVADRAPDEVAVVEGARAWSYAQVKRRALAVARWLRAQGVQAGALVPVLSPRSGELSAAWLGTLWVGAVITPLDPRWPDARLAEALEGLSARAALVHPSQARRAPLEALPAIGWEGLDGADPPLRAASGEAPVYAIFTSGTTGRPRLALNHARGLNNRLRCMDEAFGKQQVTLQTTFHAYDTAIWQLLWPLTRGGQVHVPPDEALLEPEALLRCIERGVTILDLVPSVARALSPGLRASPAAQRRLGSVRHVILGGEAPSAADMAALRALCPDAALYNIYGPTEATIGCLVYEVRADAPGPLPMGRPLANVEAVILDARGRLAPPGVAGQLALGGACVGLGYANNPEATARAFCDRDLWGEGAQRLYLTGDRAVYRSDGALVFLGRGDGQVKIRGARLELRGLEATLAPLALGQELALLALEGPRGAELVAFVAPGPVPEDLPRAAAARVEPAALPARWIALDSIPLAPSGKRDEAALAALGRLTQAAPAPPSPDTALGLVMAAWGEVLGLPVTDPESNFLQLGGHSLLWVEVQARLEARLGRPVPVSRLLQAPTARALAVLLEAPEEPASPRGRQVVRRPRRAE